MSGGSYNYLYCRAPDDILSWAETIQKMGEALIAYPLCAGMTMDVLSALREAARKAESLAGVWKAQEWLESGDWGRAGVRAAAVRMGEALPPCQHQDMGRRVGFTDDDRYGGFDKCNDCGYETNFEPRAKP